MRNIKKVIKNLFGLFGLNVSKNRKVKPPNPNADIKHLLWFQKYHIKSIFDIGANVGQFAYKFSRIFPDSKINCFEPIPEVYETLKERFKTNSQFSFFNCALGEKMGTNTLYLNDYSPSSSLLMMEELHKNAFANTSVQHPIIIKTDILDNYFHLVSNNNYLVKIDVQGYELQVLKRGIKIIKGAKIIIIEVSFEHLYKGQPSFNEIYNFLFNLGFEYHGNIEQLLDPRDSSILQADALFIKRDF